MRAGKAPNSVFPRTKSDLIESRDPSVTAPLMESPDPEVIPGKSRFGTRYSRAFKLRVLALADSCTKPGDMGRLLRQEGIIHATLTAFRRQRAAGQLDSVHPAPSKSKKQGEHPDQTRLVMQLERENRRLKRQLEQAEAIIDVQKKVSRLLEISFDLDSSGSNG